jgi:hypothetical protein
MTLKSKDNLFAFGDRVRYDIQGHSREGFVIGFPSYSKDRAILMLADVSFHGMPINMKWCNKIRRGTNIEKATTLAYEYNRLYPTFLQDIDDDD